MTAQAPAILKKILNSKVVLVLVVLLFCAGGVGALLGVLRKPRVVELRDLPTVAIAAPQGCEVRVTEGPNFNSYFLSLAGDPRRSAQMGVYVGLSPRFPTTRESATPEAGILAGAPVEWFSYQTQGEAGTLYVREAMLAPPSMPADWNPQAKVHVFIRGNDPAGVAKLQTLAEEMRLGPPRKK